MIMILWWLLQHCTWNYSNHPRLYKAGEGQLANKILRSSELQQKTLWGQNKLSNPQHPDSLSVHWRGFQSLIDHPPMAISLVWFTAGYIQYFSETIRGTVSQTSSFLMACPSSPYLWWLSLGLKLVSVYSHRWETPGQHHEWSCTDPTCVVVSSTKCGYLVFVCAEDCKHIQCWPSEELC